MIITRTPFRVSLFGGGSDYPAWYRKHGGAVVGFAINKYCYISLRRLPPFFEHKHRIIYSVIENVRRIEDIQHPSVRAVLSECGITEGLEIHHDGDLPARSGLGSSSAFTVGLLKAIYAYRGRMLSHQQLAHEAIRIEQEVVGEAVGSQDQTWAAFGGFNRIRFGRHDEIGVDPVIVPKARKAELLSRLLLCFTNVRRVAATIAQEQIDNLPRSERQITRMTGMVDEALAIIGGSGPIDDLGDLLHESWMLKRSLAGSVSPPFVDEIYRRARDAGARGGKLLGAGGGGFMLLFVEPERRPAVEQALEGFIKVDFDIDYHGSTVVVYDPDDQVSF
ncbi:GHMP kinase [Thalassobaculum fulvum]|uniref:GHMP kinase n=1 Tax=Thalassobaculum fulvum TaxID=1633335 RepID=A0A918XNL5_9PROT|nr:kinase [Thalassobaculum fulvum]GHD41077.1 GHMP kinase [Thalassobaculum fulvum]